VRAGVAAIVVLVALGAAGTAAADPPRSGVVHVQVRPGTPLLGLGKQLFGGNCVTCHGSRGEGISHAPPDSGAGAITGLGPSLRGVGRLSADFYLRTGYMPLGNPYDQPHRERVLFSERELEAMIAYVGALGGGPGVPHPHPERGDLSVGLRLFTDHCSGCHQVAGAGGYVTGGVAPPLDRATATQIAEAVRIGPFLMPSFSEKHISNAQLDSIIAYVLQTRHADDRGGWSLGHVGPVPEGLVAWLIAAVLLVATCVVIGERLRS
jgi:ubiquinol-cytochrome c reductase cytochrome c subunit